MNRLAQLRKQRLLEGKRERAIRDLRYLAVDICDYDLMAGPFHREMFSFVDKYDDHKRVAVFAPRKSYKSRMECVEIIREIIKNPEVSIALIHHKLDLARELVMEVAELIQKNEKLRELLPNNNTPGKRYTSFVKKSQGGEFCMPGTARAKYTLKGFSADQDETGGHPDIIFLDDVISAKTIEFHKGTEGLKNWIQHTVIPMAGAGVKLRVKGTMWSPDDWYSDIMMSDNWAAICRAILETDEGEPDEDNGVPIEMYVRDDDGKNRRPLNMADIQLFKEEMGFHFAGQMMNNPTADGSRPWEKDRCEHFVSRQGISKLIQKIVVLADPAPLGMDSQGRLVRGDGIKDYWANAVIGYIRSERRTIRVLLDGNMSQEWGLDEGLNDIKRLMRKWRAKIVGIEEPLGHGGIGFYARSLKDKFGERDQIRGYRVRPVKFASTQKGKYPRIMDLAAMAGMTDEEGDSDPLFLICADTCNPLFLQMFLGQARTWAGKDSIKYDDCLDVVAYSDDPALMEVVRLGNVMTSVMDEMKSTMSAPPLRRSRHCSA